MSKYLIPLIILFIFVFALFKKVKLYETFTNGAKSAIPYIVSIFPFLVSIFILTELFEQSGLSSIIANLLSPVFNLFGIPKELTKLVLIKPFSGSGSLAMLSEIFAEYGVDAYISRCACVIYGSSETVFYIASVYFVSGKKHKFFLPITISLVATFFSCVFACFICKIL